MSPAYCQMKINELQVKKVQCEQNKTELIHARSLCQEGIADFARSKNKFTQGDIATIKKEDSFEGEMADTLKNKVTGEQDGVDDISTKGEEVVTAISMGTTALDTRIATLRSEIAHWENQRIQAINQLAARP